MCSNYTQRCEQLIHNPIHTYYSIALLNMSIFSFNLLHLVSLIIIVYHIHRYCSTYTHFVDNFILVYTHLPHIIPHPTAPPYANPFPYSSISKVHQDKQFHSGDFLKKRLPQGSLSLFIFLHTLQEANPIFYQLLVGVPLLFLHPLPYGGSDLVLQANLK